MTLQDIVNIDDFIDAKQTQYAQGLALNDSRALLESSDELGNAFYLIGKKVLAGKWVQEYRRLLGNVLSAQG
ncbi:MAG TPA: hypothetical protein DCZ95_19870 [Verrucomicrobia bacterium]|nr:MAG: hypothetical protein A2X46_17770 [Lentisphaerae bacterium GWF2_57_35]HBA86344.1 hypothetical protein [Verrucomicrobiota bacterium]